MGLSGHTSPEGQRFVAVHMSWMNVCAGRSGVAGLPTISFHILFAVSSTGTLRAVHMLSPSSSTQRTNGALTRLGFGPYGLGQRSPRGEPGGRSQGEGERPNGT